MSRERRVSPSAWGPTSLSFNPGLGFSLLRPVPHSQLSRVRSSFNPGLGFLPLATIVVSSMFVWSFGFNLGLGFLPLATQGELSARELGEVVTAFGQS